SLVIVGNAKLAERRKTLTGKGFVQLDHVKVALLETKPRHQLARGRNRSDAHDARRYARGGPTQNAGGRREAIFPGRHLGGEDETGRAIVHARGVARGHRTALAKRRWQFG